MRGAIAVAIVVVAAGSGRAGTTVPVTASPPAAGSAVAISAGLAHTCALTGTRGVKCWGSNGHDELGNGMRSDSRIPVGVSGLRTGIAAIAAGIRHHCALTRAGGVKCWGHTSPGTLGDGTNIRRFRPVDVVGLSRVAAIAAGHDHTCALTSTGGVKCWGYNRFGSLGDGTTADRWAPVDVVGMSSGVTAIAAGFGQSCALTSVGGVKCWGSVGGDRSTPADVPGLSTGVTAIATAGSHSCALMRGGRVKCWGRNSNGQLGDGTLTDRSTPVDVVGLGGGVTAIGTGAGATCALVLTGAVRCWGLNDHGQLGDGTTVNRPTPIVVSGLGRGVAAIALGSFHGCALTNRGGVKCWGSNASGQLGDGTTVDRRTATGVVGLGEEATLAILSRSAAVTAAGAASVRLRCRAQAPCEGRLILTAFVDGEQLELGRRTFSIAPGRTRIVSVELTRRSFTLLDRLQRLSARAHARYKQPAGGTAKATATIALRAP